MDFLKDPFLFNRFYYFSKISPLKPLLSYPKQPVTLFGTVLTKQPSLYIDFNSRDKLSLRFLKNSKGAKYSELKVRYNDLFWIQKFKSYNFWFTSFFYELFFIKEESLINNDSPYLTKPLIKSLKKQILYDKMKHIEESLLIM